MSACPRPLKLVHLAVAAAAALALQAHAAPSLIATGTLGGAADRSSATAAPLESGVAGNILGGLGSALAWAGGTTFLAAPDRGPNADTWNTAVDNTTSYIPRFQTLNLSLAAASAAAPLPFVLTPQLQATTLLWSAQPLNYGPVTPALNAVDGRNYFSGRSDNFAPGLSTNPMNARLDPEGLRVSKDGRSVFISDEYGPYVYQFDRATGQRLRTFALPGNLAVSNLSSGGDAEISGNTSGRVANKGMEGLAITPDGKTLVGIMQAPLLQDAANPASAKLLRIVTIDIATGATKQFGYQLTDGSGVSEIVALNDHMFIVGERDGKGLGDGSAARVKKLYLIDLQGATDISNLAGSAATAASVAKSTFGDLISLLNVPGGIQSARAVPAKIEGLAIGQDVTHNGSVLHTLYVANDNDFQPAISGTNQFFVIGFSDADLQAIRAGATLVPQAFDVPEPGSVALALAALAGLGIARRRQARG